VTPCPSDESRRPEGRTWRYTQFCEHYKAFAGTLKRSMRQHRRAGGEAVHRLRPPNGTLARRRTRAGLRLGDGRLQLRVRLRHVRPQRLNDWVEGMVRALHFYGGVPQLIVPDNASAVIASPDRYEPRANETVQDLARHYGGVEEAGFFFELSRVEGKSAGCAMRLE
jgi:transposase